MNENPDYDKSLEFSACLLLARYLNKKLIISSLKILALLSLVQSQLIKSFRKINKERKKSVNVTWKPRKTWKQRNPVHFIKILKNNKYEITLRKRYTNCSPQVKENLIVVNI